MAQLKNTYSFFEIILLAIWVIRSKLINRSIRIIRFPISIRGKKFIDFGESLTTGMRCRFDCFSKNQQKKKTLIFGKNVQLNDNVHIVSMERVTIEDNVLMASNIFISDNSHGYYKGDHQDSSPFIPPINRDYYTAPIKIEKNVWIGEGVMIMPGVTIGEGSIIGAHAVVTRNIPKNSIAVGSPAIVIKEYNETSGRWERVEKKDNHE